MFIYKRYKHSISYNLKKKIFQLGVLGSKVVISDLGKKNWKNLSIFLDFSSEMRKIIYTSNIIENLN